VIGFDFGACVVNWNRSKDPLSITRARLLATVDVPSAERSDRRLANLAARGKRKPSTDGAVSSQAGVSDVNAPPISAEVAVPVDTAAVEVVSPPKCEDLSSQPSPASNGHSVPGPIVMSKRPLVSQPRGPFTLPSPMRLGVGE
jgi:hypothetical protein